MNLENRMYTPNKDTLILSTPSGVFPSPERDSSVNDFLASRADPGHHGTASSIAACQSIYDNETGAGVDLIRGTSLKRSVKGRYKGGRRSRSYGAVVP